MKQERNHVPSSSTLAVKIWNYDQLVHPVCRNLQSQTLPEENQFFSSFVFLNPRIFLNLSRLSLCTCLCLHLSHSPFLFLSLSLSFSFNFCVHLSLSLYLSVFLNFPQLVKFLGEISEPIFGRGCDETLFQ